MALKDALQATIDLIKNQVEVHSPKYGWGKVTSVGKNIDGKILVMVRWEDAQGRAGGWYEIGTDWKVKDGVKLRRMIKQRWPKEFVDF